MSIKTLRIIAGITTIVAGAAAAIVTTIGCPNAALINGVIVVVAGAIDEICSLFINAGTK